jgi:hypothetical protein
MRIRILLFTLMRIRIRILPFTLMWIRFQFDTDLHSHPTTHFFPDLDPRNATKWPSILQVFHLWCGCGSGFRFFSGPSFPKLLPFASYALLISVELSVQPTIYSCLIRAGQILRLWFRREKTGKFSSVWWNKNLHLVQFLSGFYQARCTYENADSYDSGLPGFIVLAIWKLKWHNWCQRNQTSFEW